MAFTGVPVVVTQRESAAVVCGIATDFCVLKTAIDTFERNLTPWVIEDALYQSFRPPSPRGRPARGPQIHRRRPDHPHCGRTRVGTARI